MDLPKNIRQIGENNSAHRIYIEDYVITYFHNLEEIMESESKIVVLLGQAEKKEGIIFFYISGAIEIPKKRIDENNELFGMEDKEYIIDRKKKFFPELDIVGWIYLENEFNKLSDSFIWNHSQGIFEEEDILIGKISDINLELKWYICTNKIIQKITAYAIFYDQNAMMQNYLITWHKEKNYESSENVTDHATKKFRSIVKQKQRSVGIQTSPIVYITCFLLLITISVIGVTTINRYDKMLQVEKSIMELAKAMQEKEQAEQEKAYAEAIHFQDNTSFDSYMKGDVEEQIAQEKENREKEQQLMEQENQSDISNEQITPSETENAEKEFDAKKTDELTYMKTDKSSMMEYCVKEGDTLAQISYQYYQTVQKVDEICRLNNIENPNNIIVGEKILLP